VPGTGHGGQSAASLCRCKRSRECASTASPQRGVQSRATRTLGSHPCAARSTDRPSGCSSATDRYRQPGASRWKGRRRAINAINLCSLRVAARGVPWPRGRVGVGSRRRAHDRWRRCGWVPTAASLPVPCTLSTTPAAGGRHPSRGRVSNDSARRTPLGLGHRHRHRHTYRSQQRKVLFRLGLQMQCGLARTAPRRASS
jgi:hypothetical protein